MYYTPRNQLTRQIFELKKIDTFFSHNISVSLDGDFLVVIFLRRPSYTGELEHIFLLFQLSGQPKTVNRPGQTWNIVEECLTFIRNTNCAEVSDVKLS